MKSSKTPDNCSTYIGAERFHWHGKLGVEIASCLPYIHLSRLWSDSCDLGFICVSPKTHREVPFVLVEDVNWTDGGMLRFRDTEGLGLTIEIFND